jgi:ubiquinone/menaquinone biosynthesis C-methylase UbiE
VSRIFSSTVAPTNAFPWRKQFRQANALDLPFQDGTFDHVWSYAVTMNIADKEGLGREVARVLKPGGRFSCNEIGRGSGEAPVFSVALGERRGDEFPCDTRGNVRRS